MHPSPPQSPLPIRLRLGGCSLDLASRELHAPQAWRPARLTPKAVAVLQVLAAHAGQVVSREQLLAEVWPATLPTNDVVTQAITQLRKALAGPGGDRGGGIETIAKTGYRLLLPVVWEYPEASAGEPEPVAAAAIPAAPVPAPAARSPGRRRRAWRRWLTAACLVLLAFGCGLLVAGGSRSGGGVAAASSEAGIPLPPYRLITSSGNFDITPTLSPDGSMVAYTSLVPDRAGTSILIKTTDTAPPRPLSRPAADEEDRLPAWSPDGREIAFARHTADGRCRVMVASANGAADENEVARCDGADMLSFSWSPDGHALLFGTTTGPYGHAGISRLDLDSGHWHVLRYRRAAADFDYGPRYSPDGRWIAFVRNPQMGDLWLMPAEGGPARPLTADNAEFRGLDWLPGSRGLVFGQRVDSQTRLYRMDLEGGHRRDLGLEDAQAPAVSLGRDRLAFVQRKPRLGLYRITADGRGGVRREHLFASNGRDSQPMVSPDGRQLVFASDRSGDYALWWAPLDAPAALRPVEGLVPQTRQPPDWSSDSRQVLVVGREGDGEPALYEVTPAGNRFSRLPVPDSKPLQGIYLDTPGRLLVLAAQADGGAVLHLYDRSAGPGRPWTLLASLPDVSQVRWDRSRHRLLFTRFSDGGLWSAGPDLAAGSVHRQVADEPTRWRYRSWAVDGQGQVRYLASTATCSTFQSTLGVPGGECLDAGSYSAINGFSVDRASAALYVSLADEAGSGIGFMRLPHRPAGVLGVVSKLLFGLGK